MKNKKRKSPCGRKPGNYVQAKRLLELFINMLKKPLNGYTISQMAKMAKRHERTIQRDLNILKSVKLVDRGLDEKGRGRWSLSKKFLEKLYGWKYR